jgi:integrase
VRGWTLHDLRRTAASRMVALGVDPVVVDAVLNHAQPVLRRTYQQHAYLEERRQAIEAWSAHIAALVS